VKPNIAPRWPWVILFNGLDSSTEVEIICVAERIANQGIAVVIPEFPGSGIPLADGIFPHQIWKQVDERWGEWFDASRFYTHRFAVAGVSFGGLVALNVGLRCKHRPIAILNLSAGTKISDVTTLPRRLSEEFAFVFGSHGQCLNDRLRSLDVSDELSLSDIPLLNIIGQDDDIFDGSTLPKTGVNKKPIRTVIVPGEGHMFLNRLEENLSLAAFWLSGIMRNQLLIKGI
jgi:pimeloyl-ACP methyl ester carboxylesterase